VAYFAHSVTSSNSLGSQESLAGYLERPSANSSPRSLRTAGSELSSGGGTAAISDVVSSHSSSDQRLVRMGPAVVDSIEPRTAVPLLPAQPQRVHAHEVRPGGRAVCSSFVTRCGVQRYEDEHGIEEPVRVVNTDGEMRGLEPMVLPSPKSGTAAAAAHLTAHGHAASMDSAVGIDDGTTAVLNAVAASAPLDPQQYYRPAGAPTPPLGSPAQVKGSGADAATTAAAAAAASDTVPQSAQRSSYVDRPDVPLLQPLPLPLPKTSSTLSNSSLGSAGAASFSAGIGGRAGRGRTGR
jgi:hypothetical protein